MFKGFKWLKGVKNDMEKLCEGILSNKLESLFELAQSVQKEFELIDERISIYHRKNALEEYNLSLSNYQQNYSQIAEQLVLYTPNIRTLLDFIAEWGLRDPYILQCLAEKLQLTQSWGKISECRPKIVRR